LQRFVHAICSFAHAICRPRRAIGTSAHALCIAAPLLFCAHGLVFGARGMAQTITIRMINAKSGKPIDGKFVHAEFQGASGNAVITVDKHGIGHLSLPPGATAISLIAAHKKDTIVPAYTVCGPFGEFLSIQDILDHGIVPDNVCNASLKLTAAPGEVLYFIEPLPWYTPAIE
jgi:hypothetical protein